MEISNEGIFLVEDIPVSLIAKYFEPQDDMARAYLAESKLCPYEGSLIKSGISGVKNPAKKILAVVTAHKGETLNGVLEEIKKDGWGYATLGDWYRFHTKFPFPEGEIIATPGNPPFDKDFHEWTPFVSSLGRSFLQKIIGRGKRVVAKIRLKPTSPLAPFPAERKFLIYRVIKENLSEKLKGPS